MSPLFSPSPSRLQVGVFSHAVTKPVSPIYASPACLTPPSLLSSPLLQLLSSFSSFLLVAFSISISFCCVSFAFPHAFPVLTSWLVTSPPSVSLLIAPTLLVFFLVNLHFLLSSLFFFTLLHPLLCLYFSSLSYVFVISGSCSLFVSSLFALVSFPIILPSSTFTPRLLYLPFFLVSFGFYSFSISSFFCFLFRFSSSFFFLQKWHLRVCPSCCNALDNLDNHNHVQRTRASCAVTIPNFCSLASS